MVQEIWIPQSYSLLENAFLSLLATVTVMLILFTAKLMFLLSGEESKSSWKSKHIETSYRGVS